MIPGAFPFAASIYPIRNDLGYMTKNSICISANCEYPERAMELIEFLNSDEGARLVYNGLKGVDWDVVDGTPQLIGEALENRRTNNTAYPDRDQKVGIGVYQWLCSQYPTNACADGYPINLSNSVEYIIENASEAAKDYCDYYTDGKARYVGEAYVNLVEQGKLNTVGDTQLAPTLMEPVSDDATKTFAKADEYFQTNIAKIITCADDAAFEAQKQKMIEDVMAMGYADALAELHEKFEIAQETAKAFE